MVERDRGAHAGDILALDQEMTISREDFLRTLPGAVGGSVVDGGIDIRPQDADAGWRIELTPLPSLAFGTIRLPRHRLRLYLAGFGARASRAFLERFELHFRRGGG